MTLLAPLIIPHARTWPREASVRYVGRRPWQAAPTLRLFHCRGQAMIVGMAVPPPTPQLVFREMTLDDLDDMAALLGDPEVMRYYPHPKNRDEALAWISWNQRLYCTHGYGLWLLSLRDTGVFVGDCGLTPQQVDGVTEIEVGYHVRACLQGRGLATEAAGACRDYARDVLGAGRLIAIIDPHNQPSQRVAENLGLVVARTSDNDGRWNSRQLIYAASL